MSSSLLASYVLSGRPLILRPYEVGALLRQWQDVVLNGQLAAHAKVVRHDRDLVGGTEEVLGVVAVGRGSGHHEVATRLRSPSREGEPIVERGVDDSGADRHAAADVAGDHLHDPPPLLHGEHLVLANLAGDDQRGRAAVDHVVDDAAEALLVHVALFVEWGHYQTVDASQVYHVRLCLPNVLLCWARSIRLLKNTSGLSLF